MSHYIPELTAHERVIISTATIDTSCTLENSCVLLGGMLESYFENPNRRADLRKFDIDHIETTIRFVRDELYDACTELNAMLGEKSEKADRYLEFAERAKLAREVEAVRESILDIPVRRKRPVPQAVRDAMSKPDAEALPILKEYLASLQNAAKSE